jgi:Reverse transcriptase (RNA-dependent DNA polymerase)
MVTDNSAYQGQASDDDDPGGSPNGDSDLLSTGGLSKLFCLGGSSIASSLPHRIRHKPARYTPIHIANAKKVLAKKVNTFDTPTLRDGMSRDDSHFWRNAVQTEIDTLKARETWELVPRPPRTRVLPSKMVLKIKRQPKGDVDRYKARLVALGFLQREGYYDETFSPVVDFTTVRIALALAVHEKMHVHHVDVTGAETITTHLASAFMLVPGVTSFPTCFTHGMRV